MTGKPNIGPTLVRFGHRLSDAIKLVRPMNAVMMAAGVVLGGYLAEGKGAFEADFSLWMAAVAASFIGAGGNAMNDALDYRTDAVNRPRRPVAAGRLTPQVALMIGVLLMVIGLVSAWIDSPGRGMLASAAALILIAYNVRLSRELIVGNVAVALVVGLSLVYGAAGADGLGELVSSSMIPLWCGVFFAFLMTWTREIVKDMEDVPGDRLQGYRTLPIVKGDKAARGLAIALLLIVVVGGPLPFLAFTFSGLYLMSMLGTLAVVTRILVYLTSEHLDASSVSGTLKWAMLLGMISLATFDQGIQ